MPGKLTFYDLKKKKKFTTTTYTLHKKGKRCFAKTTAPSGCKAQLFVSEEFYKKNK